MLIDSVPCPKCSTPTRVLKTRVTRIGIYRRRRCQSCGKTFSTLAIAPSARGDLGILAAMPAARTV